MNESFTFPSDDKNKIRMQWKKGVRVIGVAESFEKSDRKSHVAGIVMRGDQKIDGFGFCKPSVGGEDATHCLIEMFESMGRSDLRAWMLGGCIISWFNSVDIHQLYEKTATPVICVSYEPSEGLEKYVKEYFPQDWEKRMEGIISIGARKQVTLDTSFGAFIATAGIEIQPASELVNHFTQDGRIPEPIRVARQLAAEIRKFFG